MKVTVAQNGCCLERGGKPFFYLADTIWSAFTNMTDSEWDGYLRLRTQQGFNTLQINILPQWDRCWVPAPYTPFPMKADGDFDYSAGMSDEYFAHAAKMCEAAVQKGFTLALVVLWSNYVPGTWASSLSKGSVMPKELLAGYCEKAAATFGRFDPIYIISGDTDLDSTEAVEYYGIVFDKMRELAPEALLTLHIKGRYTYLPESFVPKMDFYLYQSGHNGAHQEKCYTMPPEMLEKYPRKPLINAEPCYEQMGYSGNAYGRFSTKDVRRAAWMSVLSGACAGITYGAHGVWNWQKTGMPYNPNTGEGFDAAKPATEAVNFPGAWDYGFMRALLAEKGVTELVPDSRVANRIRGLKVTTGEDGQPVTKRVYSPNEEIRMASTPDGKVSFVYAPFNTRILLSGDESGAHITAIGLDEKRFATPEVSVKDGVTAVEMCPFAQDVLLVIER